ncbi:MAG: alpha/beta hydrolase [Candidatus Woesebacteria bacterium]|nr:alpha/beta hydrolase [Candidatus Woesebacteria bacterium]
MNAIQNIISHFLAFVALITGLFHLSQPLTVQQTPTILNPLSIQAMRSRDYPGSEIKIEETLSPAGSYKRYIASYKSDGLKIYALLLVPKGAKLQKGWPVIILNHGYIIPEKYTPDGNYIPYADAFAKNGYIVFKPSYRGNGKSEGVPTSTYYSPDYTIDDLNAIASIKKYPDADASKIGVWGHSMGGSITLRDLVINITDIKAAVIWGGVVGTYSDIMFNWQGRVSYKPTAEDLMLRNKNRDLLVSVNGTPTKNPDFWNSVDPTYFLEDTAAPIQIDVGLSDNQVPPDFSRGLYNKLKILGKTVEYYGYPGSNHDIQQSFTLAMKRTIDFFNRYLK